MLVIAVNNIFRVQLGYPKQAGAGNKKLHPDGRFRNEAESGIVDAGFFYGAQMELLPWFGFVGYSKNLRPNG
jgi:hypothetical protein